MNRTSRMAVCGLVAGATIYGCGGSSTVQPKPEQMQLIASYPLSFAEPSDLAIDETGTILWTVRNNPEKVFQLDLHGNRVRTLNYVGQDLEGIVYDRTDHTLWVAEENLRQVVHLDLDGNELARQSIGLTGEHNSGLEGICFDDSSRMFLVNEKHPGMFIELKPDHTILSKLTLTFAGDYSAITWNHQRQCFWVVSDQSQGLYLWSKAAGVMASYTLPFPKPEGVAIDEAAHLIYIVSDSTNTMYVYQDPLNPPPAAH